MTKQKHYSQPKRHHLEFLQGFMKTGWCPVSVCNVTNINVCYFYGHGYVFQYLFLKIVVYILIS